MLCLPRSYKNRSSHWHLFFPTHPSMADLIEASSVSEATPSETGSTTTLVDSDTTPALDVKTDEVLSTAKAFVPKFLSGPTEPYVKTRIFGVYEMMEEVQSSWITQVPAWRVVESTKVRSCPLSP